MRVEEIENRLAEIDRLKRKYGASIEGILLFKQKTDEALRSMTSDEERLTQLEHSLDPLRREVNDLAEKLSTRERELPWT